MKEPEFKSPAAREPSRQQIAQQAKYFIDNGGQIERTEQHHCQTKPTGQMRPAKLKNLTTR